MIILKLKKGLIPDVVWILIFLYSLNSYSQDLKKRHTTCANYVEEFYVLKEDKSVKQGEYVKYFVDAIDRRIPVEYGFYEKNQKIGKWFSFYNNGDIRTLGYYENGLKQGLWKEFYNSDTSKVQLFENIIFPHSSLKITAGQIDVDLDDAKLSAYGVFNAGKKFGSWYYYTFDGNLVHKYNHSTHQLINRSEKNYSINECPYLGGFERFANEFFYEGSQIEYKNFPGDTYALYEIKASDDSIFTTIIDLKGSKKIGSRVNTILELIPNDWIFSEKPVFITLSFLSETKGYTYQFIFNEKLEE
ncbi:toxin-antitoxin system YwqK family antitoxin [Saccharicrinis sp. FJH62]|uniref:toxin-antitoxin system YwqK family antitoxin n=1 Tax=Saccharicrinis sp. FJH62 TaxID=3344657 RepID=UPI0035D505B5